MKKGDVQVPQPQKTPQPEYRLPKNFVPAHYDLKVRDLYGFWFVLPNNNHYHCFSSILVWKTSPSKATSS